MKKKLLTLVIVLSMIAICIAFIIACDLFESNNGNGYDCNTCNDAHTHCVDCCDVVDCQICNITTTPNCPTCNDDGTHCVDCCEVVDCAICEENNNGYSILNGTYRLILDGYPQIVLDTAHTAGTLAAVPAPAAATAIRAAWDATPNAPIIPIMTQLRTWWAGASLIVNPLLPGDITVATLDFNHQAPTTENEFFSQLEDAIFDRLYNTAHDAVLSLWNPLYIYIIIYEEAIELHGFGLVLGTDIFNGTFTVIDDVIQPEWIGLIPPLSAGVIAFTHNTIVIAITDNLTLVFELYND